MYRNGWIAGRVAVALLSVIVLTVNGYAWDARRELNEGLNGSDVISNGASNQADGATDILLIGNDSRLDAQGNPLPQEVLKELRTTDDGGGNLTDTMILMRLPNGGGRASAISFPRDTLVNLGNGYGEQKLNSAMGTAKKDAAARLQQQGVTDPKEIEKQSRAEGQRFLIQALGKLSGVGIDHYAEVNLLGFYEITKAVGGVDVCLNQPVSDPLSGANFTGGPQTIQGSDALAFVRQRHGLTNELDRVRRQQVFMSSLAQKMLSSGTLSNPSKLNSLIDAVKQAVVLDKGWDVLSFAEQMQGIAAGNIEFQTAPVKFVGESGEEDVRLDPAELRQFVVNLLLPPAERAAREQQQKAEKTAKAKTTVNVYNSSPVSGLASRVQQTLTSQGYNQGENSNSGPRPTSVVQHAPGDEAVAGQIAQSLGGLPLEPSPQATPGSVSVYLGTDYQGPGAASFAGQQKVQLDGLRKSKPSTPRPGQVYQPEQQPITANGVPCVD